MQMAAPRRTAAGLRIMTLKFPDKSQGTFCLLARKHGLTGDIYAKHLRLLLVKECSIILFGKLCDRKEQAMKEQNLLILGAGEYGHVALETAEAMGCFRKIAFLDDDNLSAIGKMADYKKLQQEYSCAFVAMGNPALRRQWLDKLEEAGFMLPALIHPKAYVSPSAELGKGTIVEPMAIVNTDAKIEVGGLLCAGCVVNHNASVGSCCQVDCNAVIAAGAVVPADTKVPSGMTFAKE